MSSERQTRQSQHGGQSQRAGQSGRGMQSGGGRQSAEGMQSGRGGRRRPQMFRSAVGIPGETRQEIVGMLNQSLADTTDLMTQCKFAHWNVKGMNFYQLHLLFDEIAETLEGHADIIAERATALGGEANGTARSAASNTRIPEMPTDVTTGPEYVAALVERVGMHANNLRHEIEIAVERDDEDTADMYTELSREIDKQLYFLESHLQAVEPDAIPNQPGASMQGAGGQGGSPSQYREESRGSGQSRQMQGGGQSGQMQGGGQSGQMQGSGQSRQMQGGQSGRTQGQSGSRRTDQQGYGRGRRY